MRITKRIEKYEIIKYGKRIRIALYVMKIQIFVAALQQISRIICTEQELICVKNSRTELLNNNLVYMLDKIKI